MYCLKYKITTLSPVVLSALYGDMNMVSTEKFIPGTTVLGLLARKYITEQELDNTSAHLDDNFLNWFLKGNLIITNGYISTSNAQYTFYPTPLSIHKDKNNKYKIVDLMFYEKAETEQQTKPAGGFCYIEGENIADEEVSTSLNFHHQRDYEKGIAREGFFFNYESILENQIFMGKLRGTEGTLKNLKSLCGDSWIAFIGRSKNTQYGKVKFEFLNEIEPIEDNSGEWENQVSLTLLSDTIIYNDFGFPTTNKTELEKLLAGAKIEKAFVKKSDIENFVGVWRLKKSSDTSFQAGSTFSLNLSDGYDRKKLAELEIYGIGERTHEGFGQCRIGWQDKKAEYNPWTLQLDQLENEEPTSKITAITKNILTSLVKKAFIKEAEAMALRDLNTFKNALSEHSKFPTNTLIEKLNMIAKKSDQKAFIEKIVQFRKPAKDKLLQCFNQETNLYDFLHRIELNSNVVESKFSSNIKQIYDKIEYNPHGEEELQKEIYHHYFSTFFTMMKHYSKRTKEK